MKQYKRYSYWLTKGGYIVNNRHGEDNPKSAGDIFLGAWYAHENTPYIRKNGDAVRDRYGKQVVLLARSYDEDIKNKVARWIYNNIDNYATRSGIVDRNEVVATASEKFGIDNFDGYPIWVFSMVDEIDNKPRRI